MQKSDLIETIKVLGIDLNEITVDVSIGDLSFHTIEWVPETNSVLLHFFEDEFDYEFDFDDFDEECQREIYKQVSQILLN